MGADCSVVRHSASPGGVLSRSQSKRCRSLYLVQESPNFNSNVTYSDPSIKGVVDGPKG